MSMKVITKTFTPWLKNDQKLPHQLVSELLNRFYSDEGYTLFPDVKPLFETLRCLERGRNKEKADSAEWEWKRVVAGVITNSDDRVIPVLKSLGLHIRARRYGCPSAKNASASSLPLRQNDIDFMVFSYDVGYTKPDKRIFDVAREMLVHDLLLTPKSDQRNGGESPQDIDDFELLFVGDDYEKDVLGAKHAGWHAVYLDRDSGLTPVSVDAPRISSVRGDEQVQMISDLAALGRWRPDSFT